MSDPVARYVMDSYALLAFFHAEKGMTRVEEILAKAKKGICQVFISIINVGEILYIIEREKGLSKAQDVLAAMDKMPLQIMPALLPSVFEAAHIKAHYPVSYADAFAVALAQSQQAMIITGDPEFSRVKAIVQIEWIG